MNEKENKKTFFQRFRENLSRKESGRIPGQFTATDARNLTAYGSCRKTLEEIIKDEILRLEDLIEYKARSHETIAITDISTLEKQVYTGVQEHFKKKGFKVFCKKFDEILMYEFLVISWNSSENNNNDKEI